MISIYLWANSVLYLFFAIFCVIRMNTSATFSGYSFLNNSGKVEYLAVYTGMEFAFAAFFAICAANERFVLSGLLFGVLMYLGIIITRTISVIYYKQVEKETFIIGALEYALFIWGAVLLYKEVNG